MFKTLMPILLKEGTDARVEIKTRYIFTVVREVLYRSLNLTFWGISARNLTVFTDSFSPGGARGLSTTFAVQVSLIGTIHMTLPGPSLPPFYILQVIKNWNQRWLGNEVMWIDTVWMPDRFSNRGFGFEANSCVVLLIKLLPTQSVLTHYKWYSGGSVGVTETTHIKPCIVRHGCTWSDLAGSLPAFQHVEEPGYEAKFRFEANYVLSTQVVKSAVCSLLKLTSQWC